MLYKVFHNILLNFFVYNCAFFVNLFDFYFILKLQHVVLDFASLIIFGEVT